MRDIRMDRQTTTVPKMPTA